MTLKEIHERTGLPRSNLRYIVDYAVTPPGKQQRPGRGTPRDYTPRQAILICVACVMKGQIRRSALQWYIRAVEGHILQDIVELEMVDGVKLIVDLKHIREKLGIENGE